MRSEPLPDDTRQRDPHRSRHRLRLRPYLLSSAGAVTAAALVAGQTFLSMLHHGHSWWTLLAWQLLTWSFWAALAPSLVASGARLQAAGLKPRLLGLRLGVAVALSLVHLALFGLLTVWLQPFEPVERMGLIRAMSYLGMPWLTVDLFLYGLLETLGFVQASSRQRQELELRESRLEGELARAQLQALRLELQPHFLFNTLNSIAALVRKRSNESALEMLLGLSHLLRMTLDRSDCQLVPLEDEVAFARRYVDLQRQRFADRLSVTYRIDASCQELQVPTLLLQPLVENAIRHGIGRRAEGGSIEIEATREARGLRLRISDDGPGLPAGFSLEADAGVGLGCTRSRLEQLYGDQAHLQLRPRPGTGTVAEILLPVDGEDRRAVAVR